MPLHDVQCKICGKIQEDIWLKVNEDPPICCSAVMQKIVNCSHFTLKYDNKKDSCGWSFNDYEHSRYWDDVKRARDRGEKVKAINED